MSHAMSAINVTCLPYMLHACHACYTHTGVVTRIPCILHAYQACYMHTTPVTCISHMLHEPYMLHAYHTCYMHTIRIGTRTSTHISFSIQAPSTFNARQINVSNLTIYQLHYINDNFRRHHKALYKCFVTIPLRNATS